MTGQKEPAVRKFYTATLQCLEHFTLGGSASGRGSHAASAMAGADRRHCSVAAGGWRSIILV